MRSEKLLAEKNIRLVFEASLIFKGLFALLEIIGGIAVYWVSQHALLDLVQAITQAELAKDPRDLVANYLLHLAQNLSIGAQRFTAFFLLSHGVVKLWLIIGLLRQKLWYYPLAAAVFGLFIVYQLYRYSFTNSLWLLVLSAVDVAVIALTWHEYRYLRSGLSSAGIRQEESGE
jgi:uncharacterized membrane protein